MREIKFRGKRINGGEWIESMTISYGTIKRKENCVFFEIAEDNWQGVLPETVGQFTGLLDKNGKEIYEGDILHTITSGFESEEYKTTIFYKDCRFQLANKRNLFYFGQSDLTRMDDTIVIGNIYDSPQLINV